MAAIAVFVIILTVAGISGAAPFLLSKHLAPWITTLLRMFIAICAIIFAISGFIMALVFFPTSDEQNRFSRLDNISIFVDTDKKTPSLDERVPAVEAMTDSGSFLEYDTYHVERFNPDISIKLSFPQQILAGNDATVALEILKTNQSSRDLELRSELRSSEFMKIWSSQDCAPPVSQHGGVPACLSATDPSSSFFSFLWTISSSIIGRRQLAIELPDGLKTGSQNNWSAIIVYDDQPVLTSDRKLVDGRCVRLFERDISCLDKIRLFTSSSPEFTSSTGDFTADIANRSIRFPIYVTTTLGVSETTYQWLAIVGVILSGAFGTGWLFKIYELVRTRKKDKSDLDV